MAADDVLLRAQAQRPQPTLRLYEWCSRALTFGYFQDVPSLVDVEACADAGIELARRPSGGGVVVHDGTLTFSLIVPAGDKEIPAAEDTAYATIGAVMVEAFRRLDIATLVASESAPVEPGSSRWCMLRPVRNDVLFEGRKVAGVARRASRAGALYQAYVFLDRPSSELLTVAPRTPIAPQMNETSASLTQARGSVVLWEEVAGAVTDGCRTVLGVDTCARSVTADELSVMDRREREVYGREAWLMGSPAQRRALRRRPDTA